MIVELFGPSGAGKSEIYKALMETGKFIPNPTMPAEEALEIVKAKGGKWIDVVDFLPSLDKVWHVCIGPRLGVRHQGVVRALAKQLLARETNDMMLVDGGLLHRSQSIERLVPKVNMEDWFKVVPVPDIAIYVTCPVDVLKQRNVARIETHDLAHDRSYESQRSWDVANMTYEAISNRCRVIRVDSTEGIEENVTHILSDIENCKPGVRLYSGRIAESYDKRRDQSPKWIAEQDMLEKIITAMPNHFDVLDVPVGTGRLIPLFEQAGVRYVGIDVSDDMLKLAAEKMEGGKGRGELAQGSVISMPCEDKVFDASFMIRLTRWLTPDERRQALMELGRVTKGSIIFTARIANNPKAYPLEAINADIPEGFRLQEHHQIGDDQDYRMVVLVPK